MKRALVGQAPQSERSLSQTSPIDEANATYEPEPLAKKTKVLVNKETPVVVVLRKVALLTDKTISRLKSVHDLCRVWAQMQDESFAQLLCRGLLCTPLVKEVYTTPSEALLDNAPKNIITLEIEDDPYATLSKDDNVPMEVEVPFDNNDPPTA
ncbi:hypothetical protein B296_00056437 [Ensete ventricosum]|uniref:Uncharacterized protein n=1 Tax=Ensete ventricosum TaxID=4639 RepID=A0A426XVA7_ENSVE|nr:hypothetical protein B296_00056437 [Ensete ventricosum]